MAGRTARAVLPSAALRRRFQKKLETFVRDMDHSLRYWVLARYREYEGAITQDTGNDAITGRLPANALQEVLQKRLKQWMRFMGVRAEDIARDFVLSTDRYVKNSLGNALRDASGPGVAIRMRMTREIQNILQALINEQTSLISSIPSRYATEVEGLVMRSVREGRDEGFLKKEFEKRYDITWRRARTIARDQTNKATESISRERSLSLGITEGIWMHRGGSRHPRESHEGMNGRRFDLRKGCYDPAVGLFIHPGELVNCNCTYKPVIPGYGG